MLDSDHHILDIAKTMHELRHLQLFGNRLIDNALNAILDGCPHLEHLDLRQCFNINLVGYLDKCCYERIKDLRRDLEKHCSVRIKDLRRPNDSTADYPFDTNMADWFF
ncbi:hypothetical protein CARUB_v10003156mg [Capsella rubella]|uniref:Uncharacterized protein n=1 Tax=Capsella rubella TaxID=81985 RepID=R0FKQ5_9BRAS|nr:hypothetical protein CARUB_v10003156mg [Capsella rubella]